MRHRSSKKHVTHFGLLIGVLAASTAVLAGTGALGIAATPRRAAAGTTEQARVVTDATVRAPSRGRAAFVSLMRNAAKHTRTAARSDKPSPRLLGQIDALNGQTLSQETTASIAATPALIQAGLEEMSSPADPGAQFYGLLPDQTVETVNEGGQVWIVPGTAGACIMILTRNASGPLAGMSSRYGGCGTTPQILRQGLIGVASEYHGAVTVFGLVPNGTTQVEIAMPDGSTSAQAVTDNTFVTQTASLPDSVALVGAEGTITTVAVR